MSFFRRIQGMLRRNWFSEKGFNAYMSRIRRKRLNLDAFGAWRDKEHVFITSTGRTGTVWLANLLNCADGVYAIHEPVVGESYAVKYYAMDRDNGAEYVREFRTKETFLRCRSLPADVKYVEITPYLNQHISFLRQELPNSYFIQIVRDGRDVVRSWMTRKTFTERHPIYSDMILDRRHGDGAAGWHEMSAFERCCWMWAWMNRNLNASVDAFFRLEDIVENYADMQELLKSIGGRIDEETWRMASPVKKNVSARHSFPKWNNWSPGQKATFRRICGEQMERYAYPVDLTNGRLQRGQR